MMMPDLKTGGMKKAPYEGIGFVGYDNYRNMYTGSWRSNLDTNVISHTGSMAPGERSCDPMERWTSPC